MSFIHCYYSLKRKKIIVEQNMQYLKCEIFELFIRFIFMYIFIVQFLTTDVLHFYSQSGSTIHCYYYYYYIHIQYII